LHSTIKCGDYHPHDRLVASAVRELARIDRQLSTMEDGIKTQVCPTLTHLRHLVPWLGRPEPTEAPLKALWKLLHQSDFVDLLPFVLEKFNTAAGYVHLPNRGRRRNLDRQVLDTYYTPLDLARWLASRTTQPACDKIRHLLATGARDKVEEALRQLLNLRICDMSCGAGILLREALDPIVATYQEAYDALGDHAIARFSGVAPFFSRGFLKLQALLTNVYGIDISPSAVKSARTVLAVWAADELQAANVTAAVVDRFLQLNIRVGSGSHWSMGVEDIFQGSTTDALQSAALEREDLRRAALESSQAGIVALNQYMASNDRAEFEIVRMFPEVFVGQNPGFACIVGNPPFGKLPKNMEISDRLRPFSCLSFGVRQEPSPKWQYPKFVEGLYRLTRRGGSGAIVTPLNLAYGREFRGLRAAIERAPVRSTFTFFDRSPDALFGDKVKTRNVVLLLESSECHEAEICTTHFLRWTRTKRTHLWAEIQPTLLSGIGIQGFVPKLGTTIEVECWRSLRSRLNTLRSVIVDSGSKERANATIQINATAYNWLPAFRHVPATVGSVLSPSMRTYRLRSAAEADVVYSCLVSSLAYWLWTVESDGFHVTNSFILNLPFVPGIFSDCEAQVLSELGQAHDLTIRSNPTFKVNAGLNILNFNRQSAAHISYQIDRVLAHALNLPSAFLEVLRERATNLVYVGREQTRAVANHGSKRETYAQIC
jgi:hypothetical protein